MIKASVLKGGDLCSFKTSPFYPKLSARQTGRYAVLKVLNVGVWKVLDPAEIIIYLVLDGIFNRQPAMHEAISLPPLLQERFGNTNGPKF
jgi:hypothetical protein